MKSLLKVTGLSSSLASSATQEALNYRDELVLRAAEITVVKTAEQAAAAGESLKDLASFTRQIEDARTTVGAPVLELTRGINLVAKELTDEPKAQSKRLGEALGIFQQEQKRLAQIAADKSRQEEQRIIDETNQKIAAAQAGKGSDAAKEIKMAKIEDKAFQQIADTRAQVGLAAAPKISGVATRDELMVEVEDLKKLYASFPELVVLSANTSAIKAILRNNPTLVLPGVRSWKQAKAIVR